MKVNHKTFSGGYKFKSFEGQASGRLTRFTPKSDLADIGLSFDVGASAYDVLKALKLTAFSGPESALVPTEGDIEPDKVTEIIINAIEVEPYDLSNSILLNDTNMTLFNDGIKALKKSFDLATVRVVMTDEDELLINQMVATSRNLSWLEVQTVESKYPINMKELLIPTILDKKYPVGYGPAHIGVLELSVIDVLHISKVVVDQKEMDTTVVALAGPTWKENIVLEVPIGTKIADLTDIYLDKSDEVRLVKNSAITGDIITDENVVMYDTKVIIALPEDRRRQTLFFLRAGTKSDSFTNSFLSALLPKSVRTADTNLHGERRACVSCAYCQNVCPVGLMPHLLHKHADKEIYNERLADYRVYDCIECGLCDYVCPSKINVSANIKKAKAELEKIEISHKDYLLPGCDMILEPKEVEIDE